MSTPNHHTIQKAKYYTAGGKTLTLREWAKFHKVSPCTMRSRFESRCRRGWEEEDALLTPPRGKKA